MSHRYTHKWVSFFLVLVCAMLAFAANARADENAPVPVTIDVVGSNMTATKKILVQVSVTVDSDELCNDQLALSYHIYGRRGELLIFEGERIKLKNWVKGEITNIPVELLLDSIPSLQNEKELFVEFDIVNETVGYWFSTSPGIKLTTDGVQYRGYFLDKFKECALKALQHPFSLLVNGLLWAGVISFVMIVRRRNKIPIYSGPFYGQFDPPVDKFIYQKFFRHKPLLGKGVFIECGAFDGKTECSCKFFEETLGWRGVNVEPSPPIFGKLVENRPNSVNVNAALSDSAGKSEFHGVVHPVYGEMCTNGSLEHTEKHKKSLNEMGCTFKSYTVPVITYADLIEQTHLKKCDLFVLDVEGNELKVIKSMKEFGRVLPKVLVVEHGQVGQKAILDAVEPLGYKLREESFVNSFFVRQNRIGRLVNSSKKDQQVTGDDRS